MPLGGVPFAFWLITAGRLNSILEMVMYSLKLKTEKVEEDKASPQGSWSPGLQVARGALGVDLLLPALRKSKKERMSGTVSKSPYHNNNFQ